jgi:hypothetical protein
LKVSSDIYEFENFNTFAEISKTTDENSTPLKSSKIGSENLVDEMKLNEISIMVVLLDSDRIMVVGSKISANDHKRYEEFREVLRNMI